MTETSRPDRTRARGAAVRAHRPRPVPGRHRADVRRHVRRRGRAEVDRRHDEVQQHVTTARSLGPGRARVRPAASLRQQRGTTRRTTRAAAPKACSVHRRANDAAQRSGARGSAQSRTGRRHRHPLRSRRREPSLPVLERSRNYAGRQRSTRTRRARAPDPGLRRAVGVAGRRTPHRPRARRARRGARVRGRAPAAPHDSRQDRTARRIADLVEPARAADPSDLPALVELARRPARRDAATSAAARSGRRARRGPNRSRTRSTSLLGRDDAVRRRRHDRRLDRRLRHRRDRDAARRHAASA